MAVLHGYFDASQTLPDSHRAPCLAVAGLVGDAEPWSRCEELWGAALQRAGIAVPFRMADFETRQEPPWNAITDEARGILLDRLLEIVAAAPTFGVAAVVRLDEYEALDRATRDRLGKPYVPAADICLAVVARWLSDHGLTERVAYFFESGDVGLPGFRDAIHRIITASDQFKDAMRILSVTTGRKRDFRLLQTADLFSWEVTQQIPKSLGLSREPMRPSLDRLLASVPVEVRYLNGDALRGLGARRHSAEELQRVAARLGISLRRA